MALQIPQSRGNDTTRANIRAQYKSALESTAKLMFEIETETPEGDVNEARNAMKGKVDDDTIKTAFDFISLLPNESYSALMASLNKKIEFSESLEQYAQPIAVAQLLFKYAHVASHYNQKFYGANSSKATKLQSQDAARNRLEELQSYINALVDNQKKMNEHDQQVREDQKTLFRGVRSVLRKLGGNEFDIVLPGKPTITNQQIASISMGTGLKSAIETAVPFEKLRFISGL